MTDTLFVVLHVLLVILCIVLPFINNRQAMIIVSMLISLLFGAALSFLLPSSFVLLLVVVYLSVDLILMIFSSSLPEAVGNDKFSLSTKIYISFVCAFVLLLTIWPSYEIFISTETVSSKNILPSTDLYKGVVQTHQLMLFLSAVLIIPCSIGALLMVRSRS